MRPATRFVVVESLFSMDGDVAPLAEYAALCRRHRRDADRRRGARRRRLRRARHRADRSSAGVEADVLVSINTAGKALGVGGAFVAGPAWAIEYLVQRARPFVFSTAPPPAMAARARGEPRCHRATSRSGAQRLRALAAHLRAPACAPPESMWHAGDSQIIPVVVGDNERARRGRRRTAGRRVRRAGDPAADRARGHRPPAGLGQRRPQTSDARPVRRGCWLLRAQRGRRHAPRCLRNRHRHGRRQDGRRRLR